MPPQREGRTHALTGEQETAQACEGPYKSQRIPPDELSKILKANAFINALGGPPPETLRVLFRTAFLIDVDILAPGPRGVAPPWACRGATPPGGSTGPCLAPAGAVGDAPAAPDVKPRAPCWSKRKTGLRRAIARTTLHSCCSPAVGRRSSVSSLYTSRRSVFARRWRRLTSMLDESTTPWSTPWATKERCHQNPSRPAS
jgi:hypothetical protein